jgi:hypothetical protein
MWWLIVVGVILVLVALYMILNQSGPSYDNSQPERYSSASQGALIMYKENDEDQFSEALVKRELAELADTPDMLQQVARQLRGRFTKYNQLKIIEKWTTYYEKGAALVEGNTKMKRAQKDNARVDLEDNVTRAKLDADKEEHLTRAAKAQHKRGRIGQKDKPDKRTEDEIKMQASREYDKRTIRYKVETTVLKNVTTLAEIQRIEDEYTDTILNHPNLSTEEKREQLKQLRRDCEEAKKNLNADIRLYEDN